MAKEASRDKPLAGTLYWQLRLLARDRGVRRERLDVLLDNELRDLRNYWRIDTKRERGDLCEAVKSELERHLPRIPPQPGRRTIWKGRPRAPFKHVFNVVFNMLDVDRGGKLETRLSKAGVSKSAAQRDLDYACEQIERQILAAGFIPQMPVPDVPDDSQDVGVEPPKPRKVLKPVIVARDLVPRSPQTVTVRQVGVLDPWTVEPFDPGRRRRRMFRRYRKVAAIAAILVLIGGGVTAFQLLSGSAPQDTNLTENPLGDALKIDFQGVGSYNLVSGIAFADDQQGDAQRMLALATTGGITRDAYNDALESGAYLVSGASLSLKLSTKRAGQNVDLFKVRVIKKELPLATYSTFRSIGLDWLPQGPGEETFAEHVGVLLDAGVEAHEVDSSGNLLGPYLGQRRVPVGELASPQLILDVEAREHGYEFQVELEYNTDGQNFSQLVTFHGRPFRVTADLCLTRQLRYKLSAPVIDTLSGMRYKVVALPDRRTGVTPGMYTTETPDSFAEACRKQ